MLPRRALTLSIALLVVMPHQGRAQGAAPLAPAEAATILWQAKAADEKCAVLSGDDADTLVNLAANAEIAAARAEGTAAANAAVAQGRQQGGAMTCGTETGAFVTNVYTAAQEAFIEAEATRPPAPPQQAVSRARTAAAPAAVPPAPLPAVAPGDVLGRFRINTAAYFVELRCRHLSGSRARKFYQAIVESQREAVSLKGRKAVSKARAEAEALARQQGACNYATASLVRSRFTDALSN